MLRAISALGFVASLMCCSAGQAQATYCDWIGPGGRAVYRCGSIASSGVTPQRRVMLKYGQPPQRHCDWVGPGDRATYPCH